MKKRIFLLAACTAALAVCLIGRSSFYPGAALFVLRWPLALACALLAVSFLRARQWPFAVVGALVFLCACGEWLSEWMSRARPSAILGPTQPFTVVTHNVLFHGASMPRSIDAIRSQGADLVALQEVTPEWLAALHGALDADYPFHLDAPASGTTGFAVFSKSPLRNVSLLGNPRAFAQCAELELADGPAALCNVHLQSPAGALYRESNVPSALERNAGTRAQQWHEVAAYLDAHAHGSRRIVAGDLNTAEMDPLMREIDTEYVDAFRATRWSPGFTFPHEPGFPPPLVRIDYVLTRGPLQPIAARVLSESGSDHLAVAARFEIGTGSRALGRGH